MRLKNLSISLILLGLTLPILAQTTAQTPDTSNIFFVPVAVSGAKNVFIGGLTKDNFQLKEDGIEQTISTFYKEDQPLDIDLILALSGLQKGRADVVSIKIREAVENFRQRGNVRNRYTVEEMPFGANGIFDAISRHIVRLTDKSTNPRKVILVLTDGFEETDGNIAKTLQEQAKKANIPIYVVFAAIDNANPDTNPGRFSEELSELGRGRQIHLESGAAYDDLAEFSGGRLMQAEADTQLNAALEELATELKNQYVLGFKSTNDAKNDKWRTLAVKIKPPAGVKEKDLKTLVRARYFVSKVKK